MLDNDFSVNGARKEFEWVCYDLIENILKRNNLKPNDIDILITACSMFNPVPSMSSMIINNFKMKETIKSYSFGGMGCSTSPISVELA